MQEELDNGAGDAVRMTSRQTSVPMAMEMNSATLCGNSWPADTLRDGKMLTMLMARMMWTMWDWSRRSTFSWRSDRCMVVKLEESRHHPGGQEKGGE